MQKPVILSLSDISFSYQDFPVLSSVSFKLCQGEFVGIIGPNGAGKSTLIRIIAALLENYQGKINLFNQNIRQFEHRELAKKLAYVPQSIELNFPFTVREVVAMGRYPHQNGFFAEDANAPQAIQTALKNMDLESLQNRPFTELSGGEKQRTVIASAVAQESDLLLLDEPTSSLDLRHQQMILTKLRKLVHTKQKTGVLVTHDINLAAQFCDRLILINQGKILADGTPEQVLNFAQIQEVYGVKVYIDVNPFTNSIYILPYSSE